MMTVKPRALRARPTRDGYLVVQLRKAPDDLWTTVHSVVARTFLGPKPGAGFVIDHKNRDKTDNRSVNLRWVTYWENTKNRRFP